MPEKVTPNVFKSNFNFKSGWKSAFEDVEFVKTFSTEILENYILKKRWYAGKSSHLKYIEVIDHFKLASKKNNYYGVLIEVNFSEAFFQNYFIPLAFMPEEELGTNTLIATATCNNIL